VQPNTNTFNILIHGHCSEKNFEEAFRLINQMGEFGCFPDNVTYNTVLTALCKRSQLSKVRDVLYQNEE